MQTISLTTDVRTFRCSDILAAITRYSHVYARVHSCAHDNWVYNCRAALYVCLSVIVYLYNTDKTEIQLPLLLDSV